VTAFAAKLRTLLLAFPHFLNEDGKASRNTLILFVVSRLKNISRWLREIYWKWILSRRQGIVDFENLSLRMLPRWLIPMTEGNSLEMNFISKARDSRLRSRSVGTSAYGCYPDDWSRWLRLSKAEGSKSEGSNQRILKL